MGPLRQLGLMALLLWAVGLVSAGTKLQAILKTSPAYSRLAGSQKSCSAESTSSVARKSDCEDMQCFCANPQAMSDSTDQCMLAYEGRFDAEPGYLAVDTYNRIMRFFAGECGTFTPIMKVYATRPVSYKTFPTPTNSEPWPRVTHTTASAPGYNNGKNDVNIAEKASEAAGPSRALKVEAIVGFFVGVATVIGVLVTV